MKRLVQAFRKMFRGEQVPETPMLALRVQDVTVSFIRVQRAETRLAEIEAREQERMMLSEGKAKTDSGLGAAMETAGKARERLRKALKELEDCRGQGGKDAGKGLADAVLPLMKAGKGVFEAAAGGNEIRRSRYNMPWNLTPSVVGLERMKHNILRYSVLILLLVGLVVVAGCSTGIKPPRKARVVEHHMEITAYCPCKQCCNWKRNWRGKAVIASEPRARANAKGQEALTALPRQFRFQLQHCLQGQ